jgi:hypothetical protein
MEGGFDGNRNRPGRNIKQDSDDGDLACLFAAMVAPFVLFLVFRHRHGIDTGKPAVEINVIATARAKRPELRDDGFAAGRTSSVAHSIRHERNMGRAPGSATILHPSLSSLMFSPVMTPLWPYSALSQPKWIG